MAKQWLAEVSFARSLDLSDGQTDAGCRHFTKNLLHVLALENAEGKRSQKLSFNTLKARDRALEGSEADRKQ